MPAPQDLNGFVTEARQFLQQLSTQNSRDWFQANTARYDAQIKRPGLTLMQALSPVLQQFSGMPVEGKLFRPRRDTRFSEDKTPYHTHLHILWACADGRGWYFRLAEDYATAGAGIMALEGDQLAAYRVAVNEHGQELAAILDAIAGRMDAPSLKRVPSPFRPNHPRGELLRRKSLVVWKDDLDPVLTPDPLAGLALVFSTLKPVQDWLRRL